MQNLLRLSILLSVMLANGCEHQGGTFLQNGFEPIHEDFSAIVDPRARWQAYGLRDYVFEQRQICFCGPPDHQQVIVQNNQVSLVIGPRGEAVPMAIGMTVDQIFAWVDTLRQQQVDQLEVEYEPRYGYPTRRRLDRSCWFIDVDLNMYND